MKLCLSDKERFKRYIDINIDTGCWNWIGGTNPKGYGRFGLKDGNGKWRFYYAHRVSYEVFVGPIPEGMHVLHDCDNPNCVNHEHLHLGSESDNHKEAYNRGLMDAAEQYNTVKSNISAIKTRRSWSHLEELVKRQIAEIDKVVIRKL